MKELFDSSLNNFFRNIFRLAFVLRLLKKNTLFAVNNVSGNTIAVNGERLRGGNMHSHVAPKLLKIVRASDKVRFTVYLDEHT